MGGYVAQEVMRQAPERVLKLALLDTSARADTPEQSQRRRDLIALSERGEFHGVTTRLLPNLIHPDRLDDGRAGEDHHGHGVVGRASTDFCGKKPRSWRVRMAGLISRLIAVPTLVLCGREDLLTPLALHEEMAALIPRRDAARHRALRPHDDARAA